ncbi:MAG: hypothetical protein HeimC3_02280 [Candidatus Heimdallarchaeota archaeon LC_3]|nr:MAG: hypothetical protein HeimC3_02280 [Candidatus Heimdallarchaeota archaeon LC_3]
MKEEFRKLNSIHTDVLRWQKSLNIDEELLVKQLDDVTSSLEDTNNLVLKIKDNPQDLAYKINGKISKLRDVIFSLENTIEETEGLEIDTITNSQEVITELRELKDQTRTLDISTKDYLKILSLIENNGHKLAEQLSETKNNVTTELMNVKNKKENVHSSLMALLKELSDISIETENLSRQKIL